jgi:hypothetical protein
VIRAAAETHVRTAAVDLDDPADARDAQQFLISLALRTTAQTWPELREAAHDRHRESIAAFAEFYAYLMEAYGFRMKTPLTITDFTEAMAAMGEGFAILALEGIEHPRFTADEGDDFRPASGPVRARRPRARQRVHGEHAPWPEAPEAQASVPES